MGDNMEPEANSEGSERPEPRSFAEILADLRVLTQSDGALHEISAIFYRRLGRYGRHERGPRSR